jgi:signal transduction histidine kinase
MRRTTLAAFAIGLTILVPCTAWFIAGSRGVAEEARRTVDTAGAEAYTLAIRLAERTSARLSALLETEGRRPYEHYGSADETTQTSCECSHTEDSPLSKGLGDPLVASHFQVDAHGRLSLPALAGNDLTPWQESQEEVYEALECTALPATGAETAALETGDEEILSIGPFTWKTVLVEDRPMLAAVREVRTPESLLQQGFLVDHSRLDASIADALYPARIQPASQAAVRADIPLTAVDWEVVIDADTAWERAYAEAGAIRTRFLRTFALGSLLALAAGLFSVGLVWQSERLAQQRSDFAAAAAHELRTPLAGMKLYGEMMAEGVGDPAKTPGYARRIVEESSRLGRVVNNVLGYARLERSPQEAPAETGDPGPIVATRIEDIRQTFEARGVALDLEIETPLPPVRFNPDAVAQILQNLIDNAEKYSREALDRTIGVRLALRNGAVELCVLDRGPGVPRRIQRKLFQPFTRGSSLDSPSGLGLGLSMVRELARSQQAEVTYLDRPGGGSNFCVRFPVVDA